MLGHHPIVVNVLIIKLTYVSHGVISSGKVVIIYCDKIPISTDHDDSGRSIFFYPDIIQSYILLGPRNKLT